MPGRTKPQFHIGIITPAPPRSRAGNRVTALRWARVLRQLGHRVSVAESYAGERYDLLIALHARKSHAAICAYHDLHPGKPLLVALTGTDLYADLKTSTEARQSLALATHLILLQPKASAALPKAHRHKARVIYQSVPPIYNFKSPTPHPSFRICVICHLRTVKDPFRTAEAVRLLPPASRAQVMHLGGALDEQMAERARQEMLDNPRYRWLGEQTRWRTRRWLAQSDLCVLSSRLEGGANVISEACVAGTPVLASRIAGNVGLLGADYPGYFKVGATRELARLLWRAETDATFLQALREHVNRLAGTFAPEREREAWRAVLAELG